MKRDFLLEIGCENLPSGYVDDLLSQLRALVEESLRVERVPCDGFSVLGTPKRLVVHVAGVAAKQTAAEERIVGPPVKVAIAPDGSWTKAAEGFAKSQGVSLDRLSRVETERGEYLAAVKRAAGKPSISVLRERAPRWIEGLRSPKAMRWNSEGGAFARPIRWILCLYGTDVVRMRAAGLSAGRLTRLSPLSAESTPVESPARYFALMKRARVVLDPAARRAIVRAEAERLAARAGGRLVEDDELVSIVANLLESPVALAGSYDASFLALPREVVVTALKSHQRYFSIAGADGALLPSFVAFADGVRRNAAGVVRGYERVLRARLDDAVFYFNEDTARPFERMAEKLSGIVWLEGLGSLADKARRVEALARFIRGAWGLEGERLDEHVARAAALAKADLASEMVKDGKEFTALQGYIGREYARVSGEAPEVAEAVFEHHLPRFAGDRLPRGSVAVLVALADKIDTITGCFIAGLEPTGSQDPYGLRRQALGVLRIVLGEGAAFSLEEAALRSIELFGESAPASKRGALAAAVREFYSQRLFAMLRSEGADHDLVAAVLAAPWEYPRAAAATAAELQRMRSEGTISPFVLAMKRIANIIPKAKRAGFTRDLGLRALDGLADRREGELSFSSSLFAADAERTLNDDISLACRRLREARRSGRAELSVEILKSIVPSINKYFDDVLVNCDDEALKNNRIAFLLSSYMAFSLFCDFSIIAGE